MVRFLIGDLLTGQRIQFVSAKAGAWSEVLNDAGAVSCTIPLKDPTNRSLDLYHSATVGKAFLAAVDGDLVLQAGPIWRHDFDSDAEELTLTAAGMWSYFDHRTVLPVLAGRNPTDDTTDTRFWPIVSDPEADGYPWASDTRKSLQGIARYLVEQAQTWTGGNVPVILPSEIAGTAERWYRGADLASVGERLQQLTQVDGGPDIMFTPRWTTNRQGIEWVMRIGTPSEPLLYSSQRQKFYVGIQGSSVSRLQVSVDGTDLASNSYAVGGRSLDETIITTSVDATLPSAGYAVLEAVDSTHSTTSEESTLQGYSDELTLRGRTPATTFSFSHDLNSHPYLEAFNAGDFAEVRVTGNAYLPDDSYSMRVLSRAGELEGRKVALTFGPEVS